MKPKVTIHRSLESSEAAFVEHFRSLSKDYGSSIVVCNLLASGNSSEEILTSSYKKLIDQMKETFE
jgi:hypothetical protein